MNGEKKNIHLPHWTGFMSWIRSLLINQIHENDLTLAIEPDSLRSVSSTDGVLYRCKQCIGRQCCNIDTGLVKPRQSLLTQPQQKQPDDNRKRQDRMGRVRPRDDINRSKDILERHNPPLDSSLILVCYCSLHSALIFLHVVSNRTHVLFLGTELHQRRPYQPTLIRPPSRFDFCISPDPGSTPLP